MRVIFLDYDGVLNRFTDGYNTPLLTENGISTMAEPELVYRLNLIVMRTGAKLVLSSSWRHSPTWREEMKASGIVEDFFDRTPRDSDHKKYEIEFDQLCRGHNIQDWLDEHSDVEGYAIIDDCENMLISQAPNFFKTDTTKGLTPEIADAIEKHLSPSG